MSQALIPIPSDGEQLAQMPVAAAAANPDHVSRQDAARKACEAAGIVWPGTILPPGTALYTSGADKLESDRAAWKRLPLAGEVIGLVEAALRAEDRQDYAVKVQNVRLRPRDGRLVKLGHEDRPGLGYSPHTLRQLVQQVSPLDDAPRGFTSALVYLSDQERAEILNRRLARMTDGPDIIMRTRLPHSGDTRSRIARAALSEIYGSVTDADIAVALGRILQGDTTGRLDYKPGDTRSRFEVIWPAEIPVQTFVVGDVHYAALSIGNSETGQGGLRICPAVIRAACANLTISTGEGTEVVIRHVGDSAVLMGRLQRAIRAALDDMEPLLQAITLSARVPLTRWEPAKAFAAIAARYALPRAAADAWGDVYAASHYPATAWGLSNAITEAAHSRDTWADSAEWERVGSTLTAKVAEVVKGGMVDEAIQKAISLN